MGREQTDNNKISEIYSVPDNKFYREKNKSEKEDGECCVHACVCVCCSFKYSSWEGLTEK